MVHILSSAAAVAVLSIFSASFVSSAPAQAPEARQFDIPTGLPELPTGIPTGLPGLPSGGFPSGLPSGVIPSGFPSDFPKPPMSGLPGGGSPPPSFPTPGPSGERVLGAAAPSGHHHGHHSGKPHGSHSGGFPAPTGTPGPIPTPAP